MRRLIVLPLALLLLWPPDQALAHGFERSQDIPLPFWLYLFGINAVVLATFVQIALSVDAERVLRPYPRLDLLRIGPLRAALTIGPLLLRPLSVGLFLLVILSGLLGDQTPALNFAPTFIWITWWVGLGFFTAFVGNVWPLLNPWKILFEWAEGLVRRLGVEKGLELRKPYPTSLGAWPALALYAIFVWVEIVFESSSAPSNIALLALLYSGLTWGGMVLFGKEVWLRNGEAFSVFFGILARFAPTEVRVTHRTAEQLAREFGLSEERARTLIQQGVLPALQNCSNASLNAGGECVNCYECFVKAPPEDRELNLRPPAVGLGSAERVTPDLLVFVLFVLSSVTYDSLLSTPLWAELQRFASIPETLGLVALPLLFLALYLGFVKLSQFFGGGYVPFGRIAGAYVYSLVPIAIVYQVAHYYTLFLVQGQQVIALLSDPLGWGWDLFGTADYEVHAGFVDAAFVWYSQVALIVAGHVVAVYLGHVVALRLLRDPRLTARSQYPMLALMILYTVFSLWILSQPSVEQNDMVAQADGTQTQATISTIAP